MGHPVYIHLQTEFSTMKQLNNVPPVVLSPIKGSNSAMERLQKFIENRHNLQFDDYFSFQKWSVDHLQEFWEAIWDFSGVISAKKYDEVFNPCLPIHETSGWFKGALVNYGENLLKYRDERVAFITAGEDSDMKRITYAQMYEEVKLYAAAFRKSGLKKGDVVSCYMSNRVEAVFAMIAAISIGAIFTGTQPYFGPEAVISRIKQMKLKFLLTVDRFKHEGKEIEMLPKLEVIAKALEVDRILILASKGKTNRPDITTIKNSCFLDDFLEDGRDADGTVPPLQFEYVPPSHPVFIIFTSGTTGDPKALVLGFGALVGSVNNFLISFNSDRDSVWLSTSPAGWVTWNAFASVSFWGGTVVLFESCPYYLSKTFLWDLIDEVKISHILISASVTDELEKRGNLPTEKHKLDSLKVLVACSSVVKPESYDFILNKVKRDVWYTSNYGNTENMGPVTSMPCTLPVRRGEIPSKCLGTAFEVVDDKGNPIVGEQGSAVLTKSFPGLLLGIYGDKDGSVAKEIYFSKFPGKFYFGDRALINPKTNGLYILGRSDTILNQRGCTFGSGEIYSVVEKLPDVRDSLCVSKYNKAMDESAVLFVKMFPGRPFDDVLVKRIRKAITTELNADRVPDFILETEDIPYNLNGKKMESLVRNIINNRPYQVSDVRNPDSLKNFFDRSELSVF